MNQSAPMLPFDTESDIPTPPTSLPRRKQGGIATTNVTMSAHVADNAEVLPKILALHVKKGRSLPTSLMAEECFGGTFP